MKAASLAIISMLLITAAPAQELKLAGVDYFSYAKAHLKDDPASRDISFQEIAVYANFPKQLKNKKTIIINGLRYAWVQPTMYTADGANKNSVTFHTISYNLRLIQRLKNNWTAGLVLTPTLASDFKSPLSGDDFVMQGSFTLIKRLNEKTQLGGGLAYNTTLGIPVPLPIAILFYNNKRHRLNAYLPSMVDYTYALDGQKKWKAGFRLGINGAYFNHSGNSTIAGQKAADKINYSRANLGPTFSYRAGKYLQLEAFGGLSGMRRYRYKDMNGEETKFDSRSGGFFNIGITLLPPEKPKTKL